MQSVAVLVLHESTTEREKYTVDRTPCDQDSKVKANSRV
jgi:hypothetical protein